jgi:hypothetical protein
VSGACRNQQAREQAQPRETGADYHLAGGFLLMVMKRFSTEM